MRLRKRMPISVVASALVLLPGSIACNGAGVTEGHGSIRVQVEGLVTVGGNPAVGTTVTLAVPETSCTDPLEASTYTEPGVVVTGADGRYSVSLIVRGLAPRDFCVVGRANGVRVEKAGVPFTAMEAGTSDTTQLDIVSP